MIHLARGQSTQVRFRDPGFAQALQVLRREGRVMHLTLFTFTGMPKFHLEAAAREVAEKLGRTLLRLDLMAIASKYIGETEKNLARLLSQAQAADAVLLLDEADALFGRRTSIRDTHDRYANLDTAAVLAELERYQGILILCFNFPGAARKFRGGVRELIVRFPPT